MKTASPQLPPLVEDISITTMIEDGEIENGRLFDEEASNTNVAALELSGVMIERVNFMGAQFGRINAHDVLITQSDFSSASLADGSCNRIRFTNCRLTGLDVSKTALHDVVFQGCKLNLANFRFADLRRVQFVDCTFEETDFLGAALHDVSFQSCTLDRTVFNQIKAKKLDLRTSQLYEISGWQFLRGATIDNVQLSAVAPYLAHELGLIVRDD